MINPGNSNRGDGAFGRDDDELNPDHPVTKAVRGNWHKVAAMILFKLAPGDGVVITPADIEALTASGRANIVIRESKDKLTVFLCTDEQARDHANAASDK